MGRRGRIRPVAVHLVRVALVLALLALIPPPPSIRSIDPEGATPPSLTLVRKHLPAATTFGDTRLANGMWPVLDASGETIATVARSLPEAVDVIGYRGPSESMILLDAELDVIAVDLIASSDTEEHVDAVQKDPSFFEQFTRWAWGGPQAGQRVDAVSGATLTSMALAKGVLKRIGGDRPSLIFPDEVQLDEVQHWFPDAASLRVEGQLVAVVDGGGRVLGRVLRTGPLSDSVIGYQGPTELLIKIAATADATPASWQAEEIRMRSSFDNQPYVRYCKTEYGFWALFKERSLGLLSAMDVEQEGVEGVSGATMTSLAIADTLAESSERFLEHIESSKTRSDPGWLSQLRWSREDAASIAIVLLVPLFRYRGWFRDKRIRLLWLASVIAIIGWWTGNLVSMALVAGWSAGGIAWQLAPGLAAVVIVAFSSPVAAKSNPYCNHLCPHGAVQQLVRPSKSARRYRKLHPRLLRGLRPLPGALLAIAYVTLIVRPQTDLSSWEPFHAYLIRIAPPLSLLLWAATVAFSACVPMGYCRLGCPTGRLLDYLRRSRRSDRLSGSDGVAVGLLLIAILLRTGLIG